MSAKFHVLVKHPEENRFLVGVETKQPPSGLLLDDESESDAISRILETAGIYANKPCIADLLLISSTGEEYEDMFYEFDALYCWNLPRDETRDTKAKWLDYEELATTYKDVLDKNKKSPIKNPAELLESIKSNIKHLEKLLKDSSGHWSYEDLVYRFYHGSFKVYGIQETTRHIIHWFNRVGRGRKLNEQFLDIVKDGTGKRFEMAHNQDWDDHTRPMVEAFFHAKYFLEMMVKYGNELKEDVHILPSGWASVLYLYNMR